MEKLYNKYEKMPEDLTGFFTLNTDWIFTNVNPVSSDVFEHRKDQLIGKKLPDILTAKESSFLVDQFDKVIRKRSPLFFESDFKNKHMANQVYPLKEGGIAVFHKEEVKKSSPSFKFFGLQEFMDDFFEKAVASFKNPKKFFRFHVNAPVMVKWDKVEMEKVFSMLISHAIRNGQSSNLEFHVTAGGGYAFITVKNHHSASFIKSISLDTIKLHKGKVCLKNANGDEPMLELQIPLQSN